jgi:hypothetical protein
MIEGRDCVFICLLTCCLQDENVTKRGLLNDRYIRPFLEQMLMLQYEICSSQFLTMCSIGSSKKVRECARTSLICKLFVYVI